MMLHQFLYLHCRPRVEREAVQGTDSRWCMGHLDLGQPAAPSCTDRWLALQCTAVLLLLALLAFPVTTQACSDFSTAPHARWRTASRQGVQWLVTPCGELFF